jgi:integrase
MAVSEGHWLSMTLITDDKVTTEFRFTKKAIQEARNLIDQGELQKHVSGAYLYLKDTRDSGARLKIRVTKRGVSSYCIRERIAGASPTTFKIGTLDTDLDVVTEIAQKMQREIARGIDPKKKKIAENKAAKLERSPTFKELFDGIKSDKNNKDSTLNGYEKSFTHLGIWRERQISDVDSQVILRLHRRVTEKSGERAADQIMILMRALINRAIKNPDANFKRPGRNIVSDTMSYNDAWNQPGGQANRRSEAVADYAWRPLWEAIQHLRDREPQRNNKTGPTLARTAHYFFTFTLFTGLRGGQASTIEWDQVDLERGVVSWINPEDTRKTKTEEKIFYLPICDYLWEMLREMHQSEIERIGKSQGYVFKSAGGSNKEHVTPNMPHQWRIIKNYVGENIGNRVAHDLRATFISIGEDLGISDFAIKTLVNHKTYKKRNVTEGYTTRRTETLRIHSNHIVHHFLQHIGEEVKPFESVELPDDIMKKADKSAHKQQKTSQQIIERWVKLGSLIETMNDDADVGMIKSLVS